MEWSEGYINSVYRRFAQTTKDFFQFIKKNKL